MSQDRSPPADAQKPSLSPGLTEEMPDIVLVKEEPEEQRIKHEEEQQSESEWCVSDSSAVCVKTEESSLIQQIELKKEEKQEEDVSPETQIHSKTEGDGEHSSDTETSDSVNNGEVSGTTEGALVFLVVGSMCKRDSKVQRRLAPKIFGMTYDLQKDAHTGDASHICLICKKTFSYQCNLKVHMRIHTGEKPFSCSVCKKTFAQKNHLTVHMGVHTGEKRFSCSVCKKAFGHSSTLKNHKRIHEGYASYRSSVRDQDFVSNSNVNVQMRSDTGENCDGTVEPLQNTENKQVLSDHNYGTA